MIVFAARLMRIFGPDFESGWPVLVIGAVGQLVNCGVGSVGYLLLMSGNQKRLIKVQFVMTIISVVTNLSLIPTLGMVGAALAAAGVNVGGNVWNLYEVRKALGISPYNRSYFLLSIPGVSAVLTVLLVRHTTGTSANPWFVVALSLLLGYAVFGGFAAAFAFDPDDRMFARGVWSQLRDGHTKVWSEGLMNQYRTVKLPEDLCVAAEKFRTGRFESLEALISFLLQEVVKDDVSKFDQAEEQMIEQRLKDLGYI